MPEWLGLALVAVAIFVVGRVIARRPGTGSDSDALPGDRQKAA